MSEGKKVCIICGKESTELVCESCGAKVQGEAADKKMKVEQSVRVGEEIEAKKKSS